MFVRRKINKSGKVSVQVIDKSGSRGYRVLKTFGCSSDADIVESLCNEARQWIRNQNGKDLFEELEREEEALRYDMQFASLSQDQLRLVGPEMIYGRLFDLIGYNRIQTTDATLLRALVVTRLYRPGSKLRTVEYLSRFMHIDYSVDKVYRFLDRLCLRNSQRPSDEAGIKRQVEEITFAHTKKIMGGTVSVVFYDTTTLYFESREDDIRIPGFSKDGKNANPQIVLGLLVGTGGNPIGYEIHKGNQYEGNTLIPIIQKMEKRFHLSKPAVIADAGLFNKANIAELEKEGYTYILGARIKSMKSSVQEEILGLGLINGQAKSITTESRRLVISMSDKRAGKDAKDRLRGIGRLKKRFASGNVTKQTINNRGYNRLLAVTGEMKVVIDQDKITQASRLDGLKGYLTNSTLPDVDIIESYGHLIMIERAFRFNKTDLDIRPMYHRLINRIEAHVCICFTAYTIMLELERILMKSNIAISLHRAMFLAEGVYEICYTNPYDGKAKSVLLKTDHDEEVKRLLTAIQNEK
jgi:transposase